MSTSLWSIQRFDCALGAGQGAEKPKMLTKGALRECQQIVSYLLLLIHTNVNGEAYKAGTFFPRSSNIARLFIRQTIGLHGQGEDFCAWR